MKLNSGFPNLILILFYQGFKFKIDICFYDNVYIVYSKMILWTDGLDSFFFSWQVYVGLIKSIIGKYDIYSSTKTKTTTKPFFTVSALHDCGQKQRLL